MRNGIKRVGLWLLEHNYIGRNSKGEEFNYGQEIIKTMATDPSYQAMNVARRDIGVTSGTRAGSWRTLVDSVSFDMF